MYRTVGGELRYPIGTADGHCVDLFDGGGNSQSFDFRNAVFRIPRATPAIVDSTVDDWVGLAGASMGSNETTRDRLFEAQAAMEERLEPGSEDGSLICT